MDSPPALLATLWGSAEKRAGHTALRHGDFSMSYAELRAAVMDRMAAFTAAGLVAGDAVLVLFKPSIGAVVDYWALHGAGAVIVVGDPAATKADWDLCIARTGAGFFLTADGLVPTDAQKKTLPPDCAVVFFSSGTTGVPKAIMHSRGTIRALHETLLTTWRLTPDDVVLGGLPFHTIYGLAFNAGSAIYAGATLVLMDRFHPGEALRRIEKDRVTTAAFVPAMLIMILNYDGRETFDCSSLRTLYSASAPISEINITRFSEFSGASVICNYGMTEIPGAAVEVAGDPHAVGASGKVSPGFQLSIRGADGASLPVGEVGEIAMRGPSQMLGYLDAPDLTAERVRGGWIYSQDQGRLDADGNVYVLGRMSEMIIRGGLNISPLEIEGALSRHPGVADVAVIGPEDPVLGQIVSAFVVAKSAAPGLDAALREHCEDCLSPPKIPAEFLMTDDIPRNAAGKIDRRALLARRAAQV